MGKIIGVVIQKGGTGKTTTVRNLSAALRERYNKRVLRIDLDPQATLSQLSVEEGEEFQPQYTSLDLIMGREWQPYQLSSGGFDWCDTVVADIELARAERELLFNPNGWGRVLQELLADVRDAYDYIIIDAPPSLGALTTNVIMASDGVIIPTQTEEASFKGMTLLMETIAALRPPRSNPLPIIAIQPTRYRAINVHRMFLGLLQEAYGDLVCEPIKESARYPESDALRRPITLYAPEIAQPWYDLAARLEKWNAN